MDRTQKQFLTGRLALVLVIAISLFTHFYRIDQTFIFHNDEGRDALIAFRMLDTRRPVLLGPETSVGNMYLGPFYYYLMVPALALAQLNPVGPAIMVAIFGFLTSLCLIWLGRRWGSPWTGILAGAIYALSPVMVHYSRSSWNPNVVPFFSVLLLGLIGSRSKWSGLWLGLLTGIIFQLHYVALVLPGLIFLYTTFDTWRKRQFGELPRYILLAVIGFGIVTSPFWLFESRHQFVNTRAFATYLTQKRVAPPLASPPYFERLTKNIHTITYGVIGSESESVKKPSPLFAVLIGIVMLGFIFLHTHPLGYLLVGSLLVVTLLKENVYVHYIGFLFPVVSLIFALAATKVRHLRYLTIAILLILGWYALPSLKYNLHDVVSIQTVRAQNLADYIIHQAAGRPYNIVNASSGSSSTLLYYLAISSNPPQVTDQPLLFVLCEQKLCDESVESRTDLLINGPSHPSLDPYLGYTPRLEYTIARTIVGNVWVTYDLYVATIELKP